jgi:hypothetical protein
MSFDLQYLTRGLNSFVKRKGADEIPNDNTVKT